ncbi:hypothetical protein KSP40_PGU019156 [Platanthera guangdongensis]|uniref:Uncharacterized protein n=1 Tax=Platanthera guangdongensis TaxID=2320717 RepID=A0ABR2N3P9_9ASPA
MVLISLVREYIGRMLQDISGMKVLILDSETKNGTNVNYATGWLVLKSALNAVDNDSCWPPGLQRNQTKADLGMAPGDKNLPCWS